MDKKKPSIGGLQEKIEEENQEDEENLKAREEDETSKNKSGEELMSELVSSIDYYNTFSLYFILLGHSQQIRCLYYVASKKVLVTSSDNCTVKIYDMTNGFSLYHFNLDCIVNKIILQEKKNVQNLILFSEDPYKLIIDITKEPFSFNHYSFKFNNSLQLEKINNGYYLLGPRMVYLLDSNLEYKATFTSLEPINYSLIKIYKGNILLFDAENYIELTSFQSLEEKKPVEDPKNKKAAKPQKGKNDNKEEEVEKSDQYNIITEFKVKMGNDEITECYIYEQFGFCCCQDNNLYLIDLELKKDMKYERGNLANEDEASLQMMKNLANAKTKKKKGKGKDGKKKKKK
jgi:WD40 repeat protein